MPVTITNESPALIKSGKLKKQAQLVLLSDQYLQESVKLTTQGRFKLFFATSGWTKTSRGCERKAS